MNDSPALQAAHIGVAMGLNGSDVARESADIILMDDNFASIVAAIQEGRTLFDNMKKCIAYTVSHLSPEVIPVIFHFLLGMPLGLTAVLALSMDLFCEYFPSVAISFEPAEGDLMQRPPRHADDRLIALSLMGYAYLIAGGIETIASFCAYFMVIIILCIYFFVLLIDVYRSSIAMAFPLG